MKENTALKSQKIAQTIMMSAENANVQLANPGAKSRKSALISLLVVSIMTDVETATPPKSELPGVLQKKNVTTFLLTAKSMTTVENALVQTDLTSVLQLVPALKNHSVVSEIQTIAVTASAQIYLHSDGAQQPNNAIQLILIARLWITDVEFVFVNLDLIGV